MPVVTVAVTTPVPVPEAGLRDNQAALSLADQLRVPPPVLLMVKAWAAGLAPAWAVKDRLVGLAPIAGLTDSTGTDGGEINCVNPDISSAILRIVRPPVPPFPEFDELPAPAEASGMVPVGAVPAAVDPVALADNGATLMVARGKVTPTLLLSNDGALD
ncbi:MAG: hypothetical protein KJS98_20590 [Nitrospirae bacterium]|nr:hypothetical protein [Nitrospirota bacterium]MDE3041019.1 hypothetical protein [Nitrospirota bacterium]MDE3051539.1 hypothetical protein [Nitrospirota bacterium]